MKQESRSVQRRKALQQGEPMPTFEKQETLRELLAHAHSQARHDNQWYIRLAPIVERAESILVNIKRYVEDAPNAELGRENILALVNNCLKFLVGKEK